MLSGKPGGPSGLSGSRQATHRAALAARVEAAMREAAAAHLEAVVRDGAEAAPQPKSSETIGASSDSTTARLKAEPSVMNTAA